MAAHALAGTLRKDRHTFVSPQPPSGIPAMPADLVGEAAAEWDRMVVRLQSSKTLTLVDDAVLVNYCRLHGDAAKLQAALDALTSPFFEKTSVDGAGIEHREPKVHPGFAQLRAYRQALRQYLVELGLTPSSRSRVKVADVGEVDPLQEFFSNVN
jgi:P27 family predicted phage terminase small subunit